MDTVKIADSEARATLERYEKRIVPGSEGVVCKEQQRPELFYEQWYLCVCGRLLVYPFRACYTSEHALRCCTSVILAIEGVAAVSLAQAERLEEAFSWMMGVQDMVGRVEGRECSARRLC